MLSELQVSPGHSGVDGLGVLGRPGSPVGPIRFKRGDSRDPQHIGHVCTIVAAGRISGNTNLPSDCN